MSNLRDMLRGPPKKFTSHNVNLKDMFKGPLSSWGVVVGAKGLVASPEGLVVSP